MNNRLANITFYLLEPQSDDGLAYWNFFIDFLVLEMFQSSMVTFLVFKVLSIDSPIGLKQHVVSANTTAVDNYASCLGNSSTTIFFSEIIDSKLIGSNIMLISGCSIQH